MKTVMDNCGNIYEIPDDPNICASCFNKSCIYHVGVTRTKCKNYTPRSADFFSPGLISKMVAEIKKLQAYKLYAGDTKKVDLQETLDIIHKYTDKEQNNES